MASSANDEGGQPFSDEQRAGVESRRADQDRTLLAMHRLEAALGSAAPGRVSNWRDRVLVELGYLEKVTADEADNAERPDSLLSDIARTQPLLRNRVRGVRLQYRQLQDAIGSLRRELTEPGDLLVDFTDIRQRLAWVLLGLRHQRARESDLVYEAYYEAFRADLAAERDGVSGESGS